MGGVTSVVTLEMIRGPHHAGGGAPPDARGRVVTQMATRELDRLLVRARIRARGPAPGWQPR